MARQVTVGAAQMGPVLRGDARHATVRRMVGLLEQASARGCDLVVFPELALTTFFPRWWLEGAQLDGYFEPAMPNPHVEPLFARARELGTAISFGYAEAVDRGGTRKRFNTAILVDPEGRIVGRYRKVHLPGHADRRDGEVQHLEKRYFDVGDLGLPTWHLLDGVIGMCICNDRRWPETYRVLALRGAEMVILGYNTPSHIPWAPDPDGLTMMHNHLCMQAGAYQNGMWVVGVAKAGNEDGSHLIGGTCIIAPSGQIVAQARTDGDELVVATCDLDASRRARQGLFDFEHNRQPQFYGPITQQRGIVSPRG